jgi:hypothetical protein
LSERFLFHIGRAFLPSFIFLETTFIFSIWILLITEILQEGKKGLVGEVRELLWACTDSKNVGVYVWWRGLGHD